MPPTTLGIEVITSNNNKIITHPSYEYSFLGVFLFLFGRGGGAVWVETKAQKYGNNQPSVSGGDRWRGIGYSSCHPATTGNRQRDGWLWPNLTPSHKRRHKVVFIPTERFENLLDTLVWVSKNRSNTLGLSRVHTILREAKRQRGEEERGKKQEF